MTSAPRKPTRLIPAEHERTVWDHVPDEGVTLEQILEPEYWQHIAPRVRAWDRIEVRWADSTRFVELMVRSAGQKEAHVTVMHDVDLGDEVEEVVDTLSPYEVKWKGPKYKHAVVRKSDGEMVKGEFQTKGAAAKWIANRIKQAA